MGLRGWRKVAFYVVCAILLVWTLFPVYYMITLSLVPEEDVIAAAATVAAPARESVMTSLRESGTCRWLAVCGW